MFNWLRNPLSRAEIGGYLIFVAGLLVISTQGGFPDLDPWIEAGVALMIVGIVVAGRGQARQAMRTTEGKS